MEENEGGIDGRDQRKECLIRWIVTETREREREREKGLKERERESH